MTTVLQPVAKSSQRSGITPVANRYALTGRPPRLLVEMIWRGTLEPASITPREELALRTWARGADHRAVEAMKALVERGSLCEARRQQRAYLSSMGAAMHALLRRLPRHLSHVPAAPEAEQDARRAQRWAAIISNLPRVRDFTRAATPTIRPEPKSNGGEREITIFSWRDQARMRLIDRALTPFLELHPAQYVLRSQDRGREAACRALMQLMRMAPAGYGLVKVDVANFFPSISTAWIEANLPLPTAARRYVHTGHMNFRTGQKDRNGWRGGQPPKWKDAAPTTERPTRLGVEPANATTASPIAAGNQPDAITTRDALTTRSSHSSLLLHFLPRNAAPGGLPQGSVASPRLAEWVMAYVLKALTARLPHIGIVAYCDDLVFLCRQDEVASLIQILREVLSASEAGPFDATVGKGGRSAWLPLSKETEFLGYNFVCRRGKPTAYIAKARVKGIKRRVAAMTSSPGSDFDKARRYVISVCASHRLWAGANDLKQELLALVNGFERAQAAMNADPEGFAEALLRRLERAKLARAIETLEQVSAISQSDGPGKLADAMRGHLQGITECPPSIEDEMERLRAIVRRPRWRDWGTQKVSARLQPGPALTISPRGRAAPPIMLPRDGPTRASHPSQSTYRP